MTFLVPAALWWLIGLLGVGALYLIRRRAIQQQVTTLPFFMMLHKHLAESPWLRRLKRLLSFLLVALLLCLLIFALARPVVAVHKDGISHVIICLDRSASTTAKDDQGVVFERLQSAARGLVAAQPESVAITLVACAGEPEVLIAQSHDHMLVDHLIASMEATALPHNEAASRHLIAHLDGLEEKASGTEGESLGETDLKEKIDDNDLAESAKQSVVWWFGDQSQEWADENNVLTVGDGANVGITACSLRERPMEIGSYDAFVEIGGRSDESVVLEVSNGLDLLCVQTFDMPETGRHHLTIPISHELAGKDLHLAVRTEGDVLALDDELLLPIPEKIRPRIAWVHDDGDGFTALALATIDMDIVALSPSADIPSDVDAVLYEHCAVPENIVHPSIVLNPIGALTGVHVATMEPRVVHKPRALDASHPVLFGVSAPRLAVAQTARVEVTSHLAPLVGGPSGPFIAAGYTQQHRMVVLGIDPSLSPDLALTASYPSLIASSLLWTLGEKGSSESVLPTGALMDLESMGDGEGERSAQWTLPNGTNIPQSINYDQLVADRVGVFTLGDQRQGVALLSPSESAIAFAKEDGQGFFGNSSWNWWLVLATGLLLLESWACHRRGLF